MNVFIVFILIWFCNDFGLIWQSSRSSRKWFVNGDASGLAEASISDYPYMVAIYYKRGVMTQRCTGTFLTNRFILTSGICFKKFFKTSEKRVAIINSDTPNDHIDDNQKTAEIECGFIHPNFQGSEKPDDIALLRLKDKVKHTDHSAFNVTCVPPIQNDCTKPKECFAVLYSIANTGKVRLKRAEMDLIDSKDCKADFGYIDEHKQICAKIKTNNRANSLLNSGAALMCKVQDSAGNSPDIQLGIVNYDMDSVANRYPGVFIHTPYYRKWIEDTVNAHKDSC